MKSPGRLFLPSLSDVLFVSVFLYLSFSAGKGLLADADTGYHIRAGEYIIDTLSIPKQDIFSFLNPPIPWTAHEWLSEVIMASIHRLSGLTGVVIFFGFVIALTYYLLFRVMRRESGNVLVNVLFILLAVAASQLHWLARPHIFSLLLTVLWYHLLDEYQYRGRNLLYLLPLLMLFWVNLHGGYILGFILIGIYIGGNLIKGFSAEGGQKKEFTRKTKALGLTAVICLFASLVNPYGYHILLFPFKLISNSFIMDNVHEFLSPNFHESMPFKYLLFLMIAVLALSMRSLNLIELLLVLFFTNMALYSARYIPLFAIVVTPILIRQADLLMKQSENRFITFLKRRGERIASIDASTKGFLWPFAAFLLVVFYAGSHRISYSFDGKIKPVAAVEFLKREHIRGNMFNNDEFGDYIIYVAWPQYKVFFDGRSDMYGVERMKEYFKVARIRQGWEEVLDKYSINWIIFNADSALSTFLSERDDWRLIYADKLATIFVRNTPENGSLIRKYKDVRPVKLEEENNEE